MIGIVHGVQGMRWYDVMVTGQEAHTGRRRWSCGNALVGAARLIEAVDHIARKRTPAVGTVGLLEVKPNSRNVIPGEVFFTVDFRHPETVTLDEMQSELEETVNQLTQELGLAIDCKRIWDSPPVALIPTALLACAKVRRRLACRRATSFPGPAMTRPTFRGLPPRP